MSRPFSDPPQPETRTGNELPPRARTGAEQVALAEAWRAVDNAVRSIFELARSLELLSDAISRLDAEPFLEFRESENRRNRFWMGEDSAMAASDS